jgi:hypothetical protein
MQTENQINKILANAKAEAASSEAGTVPAPRLVVTDTEEFLGDMESVE